MCLLVGSHHRKLNQVDLIDCGDDSSGCGGVLVCVCGMGEILKCWHEVGMHACQ